jgi:hypothetical protein
MSYTKEEIAKALEEQLVISEQMWNDGEYSHAYIVWYLQGTIKAAIENLKEK